MTGTWRDTLFVWRGVLSVSSDRAVEWTGTWVGVPDCPDARAAPTPNARAFQESKMTFHVTGTYEKAEEDNNHCHCELSLSGGTGWDLETDGIKDQYGDSKHTIHMTILDPFKPFESTKVRTTVAAVGHNDFGSFVSAGYIEYHDGPVLTLGRRYLDANDLREKWTVIELSERLREVDKGYTNLCCKLENDNLDAGESVRIPPWRTADLHAEKLSRKRKKRNRGAAAKDRSSDDIPPLKIPREEHYDSRIVLDTDAVSPTKARWVEQCVGCGGAFGSDPKQTCNLNFKEIAPEKQECEYNVGIYCSSSCALYIGVPALIEVGKMWTKAHQGDRCSLQSMCKFWQIVESDSEATRQLQDMGWRKIVGQMDADWVLSATVQENCAPVS